MRLEIATNKVVHMIQFRLTIVELASGQRRPQEWKGKGIAEKEKPDLFSFPLKCSSLGTQKRLKNNKMPNLLVGPLQMTFFRDFLNIIYNRRPHRALSPPVADHHTHPLLLYAHFILL